jgi:hypothetical protein
VEGVTHPSCTIVLNPETASSDNVKWSGAPTRTLVSAAGTLASPQLQLAPFHGKVGSSRCQVVSPSVQVSYSGERLLAAIRKLGQELGTLEQVTPRLIS